MSTTSDIIACMVSSNELSIFMILLNKLVSNLPDNITNFVNLF